jgi:hypothetical protein
MWYHGEIQKGIYICLFDSKEELDFRVFRGRAYNFPRFKGLLGPWYSIPVPLIKGSLISIRLQFSPKTSRKERRRQNVKFRNILWTIFTSLGRVFTFTE